MDISHNTTVPLLDGKSLYHLIKIRLLLRLIFISLFVCVMFGR